MGKNQVPRGATKKEKCSECGGYYSPQLRGNSLEMTDACIACKPWQYEKKKK